MERALAGLIAGLLIGLASATRPCRTLVAALDGSWVGDRRLGSAIRGLGLDFAALCVLGALLLFVPPLRIDPLVVSWLRIPGGLLLAFLGWLMMGAALPRESAERGARGGLLPAPGVVSVIGDPQWHLFWWPAVLVLDAAFAHRGAAAALCFGGGILAGRYGWRVYLARRAARSRYGRAFTDRQYRVFTSLGGLVLVGAGMWAVAASLAETGIRPALEHAALRVFG